MVADAGLAEKQRREFFQRPGVETLKVPVGLVVALTFFRIQLLRLRAVELRLRLFHKIL